MRERLGASLLMGSLVILTSVVGVAQTTALVEDDFEAYGLGSLPIEPASTWCYVDRYNNGQPGWPRVETDPFDDKNQVLHIYTPWSSARQYPGAVYVLPAFAEKDYVQLELDFSLNTATSSFYVGIADDLGPQDGGLGCLPDGDAPVCALVESYYHAGPTDNPFYPSTGVFWGIYRSDDSGDREEHTAPLVLTPGEWHSMRLVHARGSFSMFVDEVLVQTLANPYYDFTEDEDWLLRFGDANSHSGVTTDVLVDNVCLVFTVVPPVPPEEPEEPRVVLVSTSRVGNMASMTVSNVGNAECVGVARVSAGLAYDTSWVPEWATIFSEQDLGPVSIPAGAEATFEFELPEIPTDKLKALAARLSYWWTGYADVDPQDYTGLILRIDPADSPGPPLAVICGFLVMP